MGNLCDSGGAKVTIHAGADKGAHLEGHGGHTPREADERAASGVQVRGECDEHTLSRSSPRLALTSGLRRRQ